MESNSGHPETLPYRSQFFWPAVFYLVFCVMACGFTPFLVTSLDSILGSWPGVSRIIVLAGLVLIHAMSDLLGIYLYWLVCRADSRRLAAVPGSHIPVLPRALIIEGLFFLILPNFVLISHFLCG